MAPSPHRRYNLLDGTWVLVSPHRMQRPWQGAVEPIALPERPAFDPSCYLCPGNTRAGGHINPAYADVFVFDNDFAALLPTPGALPPTDTLLRAQPETGICRVLCYSPRHDLTLAQLPAPAIRRVIDLWAEQYADLGHRPDIAHVQIFENKGELMGTSNPHPHGQIWSQSSIPLTVQREDTQQAAHYAAHGTRLLLDYLAREHQASERIVLRTEHWTMLVPWWAVWPFETLLVPHAPTRHLLELGAAHRDDLAHVLQQLMQGYDRLFQAPFPYSMGWHQMPTDQWGADPAQPADAYPHWQLHAHVYPPLLRSATIRKFMVGYELLGEPQRDLTPEAAAARLREVVSG